MAGEPTTVVTGAARGIGAEVCRQLAARGHDVVLTARDGEAAATAAKEIGAGVRSAALDVTSAASVDAFAAWAGDVDVLVHNAAAHVDWAETVGTADLDATRGVFETNVFGAWRLTQALLPAIRRGGRGRIVFVSSGAGSHGDTMFGLTARGGAAAGYGISKAAVNALVATLATELAGSGVLVNAVCPGLTATYPGAEAMGARPVPDGAAGIVWAATLPDDGPTGGFHRDTRPHPW